MNKLPYYLLLLVWLSLSVIDASYYIWGDRQVFYWRAWEVGTNYNKQESDAPFPPFMTYDKVIHEDLLKMAYFTPKETERKRQQFITDEYGFRNAPRMDLSKIKAVIIGTSNVGGAEESQSELISSILTTLYHTPTYNYAIGTTQQFIEDNRFIRHPPEYVIIIGKEDEILHKDTLITGRDTKNRINLPKWRSYDEWEKCKAYKLFDENTVQNTYNFSIIRHVVNTSIIYILNSVANRAVIAEFRMQVLTYDRDKDMLFLGAERENPLLGSSARTMNDITSAIKKLKKTQELLEKRGIKVLVVIVPNKGSVYYKSNRLIPPNQRAMTVLTKKLDEHSIQNISLLSQFLSNNSVLYHKTGTHWNAEANKIIAGLIYKRLSVSGRPLVSGSEDGW